MSKDITVKETLQMQRMRKALEMLKRDVLTDADLRAVCPRDDDRANLVALLLAGGFASATLYPVNPGSEAHV